MKTFVKCLIFIEIQKKSYQWFLDKGLREVLDDVSPLVDYSGNLNIDFIDYSLERKPKYSVEECKDRDVNYAAPLKVKVRLSNNQTGEIKDAEVFMGDFPLMTETGTFIINGAERVIVSQLVRSPGIYYDSTMDKSDKRLFAQLSFLTEALGLNMKQTQTMSFTSYR